MEKKQMSDALTQYWFDFMWERGAIQRALEKQEMEENNVSNMEHHKVPSDDTNNCD